MNSAQIRQQGTGFVFESPALYVWNERLSELMQDARELAGARRKPPKPSADARGQAGAPTA
jgi:hypothetical protein